MTDRIRQTHLCILLLATLVFGQGGPVRDTSVHLSGWPPTRPVGTLALLDTLRSKPPVAAENLVQKQERAPSRLGDCIGSAAMAFGGVLLAGTGVAYWMHFSEVNNSLARNGENTPLALPVMATVAIPLGVLMAGFGTMAFFHRLSHGEFDD